MLSFSIKLQSNLDLDQTGKERSGPPARLCAIELTDRVSIRLYARANRGRSFAFVARRQADLVRGEVAACGRKNGACRFARFDPAALIPAQGFGVPGRPSHLRNRPPRPGRVV